MAVKRRKRRLCNPNFTCFFPNTTQNRWYCAGGVGAILFGVVLLPLFGTVLPERTPYTALLGSAFLLILAGAVFFFVYGGMREDKYKVWKYNLDTNPTPEAKKQLAPIGASCGVITLTATAIYVGLGFAKSAWDTAWRLFAAGGILCGLVSIALDPCKGDG